MKDIVSFFRSNRDRYSWIFLIIIQQILIVNYLKKFIEENNNIVADYMVLIFDLVSIIYIYLAGHMRRYNDVFLMKIIMFISAIVWQHLFILSSNIFWYDLGVLMQPIITYIFTVGSFDLILYENTKFKSKVDFTINIILIGMMFIFWIDRMLFNLLYLILFIGLHLYPIFVMLYFRNYFSNILSKIRKECLFFSLFLLGVLCFNFIEHVIEIEKVYSNIGWYIITIVICMITYIRLIQNVLIIKMDRLQ